MTELNTLRWGILGPGGIAKAFAGGIAHSKTGKLVAIGARNLPRRARARWLSGTAR
jgi:predicted dehydrogenase